MKLKDYCVRLIIKDPVEYARKIEELLWRKAFYDIVYASKKLRKVINRHMLHIIVINSNLTLFIFIILFS